MIEKVYRGDKHFQKAREENLRGNYDAMKMEE